MEKNDCARYKNSYNSAYCYKGTNVIKNKLGIRDEHKLNDLEAEITQAKQLMLEKKQNENIFSLAYLIEVHRYIFEDLYYFAGKFRTEDIQKDGTRFLSYEQISEKTERLFKELSEDNWLQGLTQKEFTARAAYYMIELNMIHPFREGNGRVIRMFIKKLAKRNNFTIDWARVTPQGMLNAMIAGVVCDYEKLDKIIHNAIIT